MAAKGFFALLLLLITLAAVTSLTPDNDLTKRVEEAIGEDEFVFLFKDIKPKKRQRNTLETILSVDFPGSGQKWVFILDRTGESVILEATESGIVETGSWKLDGVDANSNIKSLIFTVKQFGKGADVSVYHNCEQLDKKRMPTSLLSMFTTMKNPHVQVAREKRYTVDVIMGKPISKVLSDKCGLDLMQAQQPAGNNDVNAYRRGDIPVFHDCDDRDGLLAKTLNALIELIKQLRQDIEYQRGEIQYLRSLLERCDICAVRGESQVRYGCNSDPPPCFHGVECRDTSNGPQCGRCPRGYVGDGRNCKPGLTCEDRPCFPGVHCYDTVEGAQCGPCPSGYVGDGQRCKHRGGCDLTPCHPGK